MSTCKFLELNKIYVQIQFNGIKYNLLGIFTNYSYNICGDIHFIPNLVILILNMRSRFNYIHPCTFVYTNSGIVEH